MGLGDFFSDIGEGIVDTATGLAQGAATVVTHLDDVGRGAGWLANPYHWDDVAEGVGNVGQFIGEHPGQIWDTGFEIGRHMVKEEILDPKNLAINLGLTAATVFTGGGAGAALATRLTGGALKAVKAGEEVISATRAGRAVMTGLRAARESETAIGAARWAERGMSALEAPTRAAAQVRKAVTGSELGVIAGGRGRVANRILGEAGDAAGLGRRVTAEVVRGSVTRPTLAADATASTRAIANLGYVNARQSRFKGLAHSAETGGTIGREMYKANKNPYAYAYGKADEVGLVDKAQQYVARKAMSGVKNLFDKDEEKEPKRRASPAEEPISTGPSYSGITAGAVVPSRTSSRSLTPDVEESEYVSSAQVIGGRRSNFYAGTSTAYKPLERTYGR